MHLLARASAAGQRHNVLCHGPPPLLMSGYHPLILADEWSYYGWLNDFPIHSVLEQQLPISLPHLGRHQQGFIPLPHFIWGSCQAFLCHQVPDCPHSPLQTGPFFVTSRPLFPDHCDPFPFILLQAKKTKLSYKQFYCLSHSLYWESAYFFYELSSYICESLYCCLLIFVTFYWILFLLWNCMLWFIKLQYFSHTILPPVICDHSLACAARAPDAAILFRLCIMSSIIYIFRNF